MNTIVLNSACNWMRAMTQVQDLTNHGDHASPRSSAGNRYSSADNTSTPLQDILYSLSKTLQPFIPNQDVPRHPFRNASQDSTSTRSNRTTSSIELYRQNESVTGSASNSKADPNPSLQPEFNCGHDTLVCGYGSANTIVERYLGGLHRTRASTISDRR